MKEYLLIKNGEIITSGGRQKADILAKGGVIVQIGKELEAPSEVTEVLDASGKYVFPGFIDPHVHVYLKVMDIEAKEGFESGSRAALCGGTTCIIDFCNPVRGEDPLKYLEDVFSRAEGKSACDYSLHISVPKFDDLVKKRLKEFAEEFGLYSWKIFLAYGETMGIGDGELFELFKYSREIGALIIAHCENADIISSLQREFVRQGKTSPRWHYYTRPPEVEAMGVHHFLRFAELTGAPGYIVHLSCEEALREAQRARERGVKTYVETLINFLLLDKSLAELPDFEGAKYIMSPPLRDKKNHPVLWDAIAQSSIDVVATDHAPFDFKGQKDLGRDNFTNIPNGIPSIQERIPLLYTYGVKRGRISLEKFVKVASTNPAKIFGLYPKKGTIAVGSDADIVIFDPHYRGKITRETQQSAVDYNAYEGWEIEGRPHTVILRGQIMVSDGQFVGPQNWGKFVPRAPLSEW